MRASPNSVATYHNTNQLIGEELKNAVRNATTQETKILRYFTYNPGLFTPEEIQYNCSMMNLPLTSVRRAITNLANEGFLRKTSEMKIGQYGKPIHAWTLQERNGEQVGIF